MNNIHPQLLHEEHHGLESNKHPPNQTLTRQLNTCLASDHPDEDSLRKGGGHRVNGRAASAVCNPK